MYVKKPAEVQLIREGGKKMGEILDALIPLVQPGVSTWEIDQEAERMIIASGGIPAFKGYRSRRSDPPFPGTICASINEEVVHGIPSEKRILKKGDIFTIDIGMQWPAHSGKGKDGNGFFLDTAVTVPVGKVPKAVHQLIDATRESMEAGILAAQNKATVADIGKAVEQYIKPLKYGIVRDLVGHGVGHEVHEDPRVPNYYDKTLTTWVLEPNVVIAIEPMITMGDWRVEMAPDDWTILTADGSLAAHFEHTIVITEDGPEVVTRRPSEL